MHTTAKLLSACITLLFVFTNALATIIELDSKIIQLQPKGQYVATKDNLEVNNFILRECNLSDSNRLQMNCNISGSPTNETKLKSCNLQINASNSDNLSFNVENVFQFVDNKLMVHVFELLLIEDKTTAFQYYKLLSLFHIFDNCEYVTTISYADENNGTTFDLRKIVIYEDGFDAFVLNIVGGSTQLEYHSYDVNGKQIGNYTVLPEQFPYRTVSWNPSTHLVSYGTKHSRGVAFTSGYHFYPNGSIIQFANDQYRSFMKSENFVNDVDDGPFFTACIAIPFIYPGESGEIGCWQYDVDNARLASAVKFTSHRESKYIGLKNLSKGGFMLTTWRESTMTVAVYRPDLPDFIDDVNFESKNYKFRVGDFDEKTGVITIFRYNGIDNTVTRSHYLLQNYATGQ